MTPQKRHSKAPAKTKKGERYRCGICGYQIIVDEVCGCAEEHIFICCEKQMKKVAAKKVAAKKAGTQRPAAKKAAKKK
jgi:hypothetical protein